MTTSTRSSLRILSAPSRSSGRLASAETILIFAARAEASSSCAWAGALGSFRLVRSPILLAPGTISRANSICFAGYQAQMNGIRERRRDDRNCRRGLPGRNRVDNGGGQDDVRLQSDHLFGE